MADFFTDSDDDKAVEEILSQAKDMVVLEQVAAINVAGLEDAVLPYHVERRFQKLKSLPTSAAKHASFSKESSEKPRSGEEQLKKSSDFEAFKESPKLPSKSQSPLKSLDNGRSILSPHRKSPKYPWDDLDLSSRSVSPPAKGGCFLCSPKNASRKKSKENKGFGLGVNLGKNDGFLSDLSNFSSKNQMKMAKKAMKEEEEICREAEKIVRWAKQASARFDVSGIEEDDLGFDDDDENLAKF